VAKVKKNGSQRYKVKKVEAGGHDIIQWELSPFHNKETTCISNNYSMQEMRLKDILFHRLPHEI
jgi:hypothetical protein